MKALVLEIDIVHNNVRHGAAKLHRFAHNWGAALLAQLLAQARQGEPLTQIQLQEHLRRLGQATALHRAQIIRLLHDLEGFFVKLNGSLALHYAPRCASTGPWHLQMAQYVHVRSVTTYSEEGGDNQLPENRRLNHQRTRDAYPRLLNLVTPQHAALRTFLQALLISDANNVLGHNVLALEALPGVADHSLSREAHALIETRRCILLRRLGRIDQARQVAQSLLSPPTSHHVAEPWVDPAIPSRLQHLIDRADYDHNPGHAWRQLLASQNKPQPLVMADPWVTGEWHNLQALALRRQLHTDRTLRARRTTHTHALRHLEAAIYYALSMRDWDRLQGYVDNLAFHLQTVIPLGLANVAEVYDWHTLSLAYTARLECGRENAWELIFFAEFWLDNASELKAMERADGHHAELLLVDDHHPSQERFYTHAIARLAVCGDPRQQAVACLAYARWAKQLGKTRQLGRAREGLQRLLDENPGLRERLVSEGYGSQV